MILGLLLASPVLFAQAVPGQSNPANPSPANPADAGTPPRDTPKVQKQQVALPQMPSGPLSQMPMEQIPATPAKVSFHAGLLEISAQNSTLGEILRDVRKLTGASIDLPPNGMNERVVTHLGPGSPRDVLDVLLHGSSFNYVMVGSSTDPGAVSSVILTAKPSASGETHVAANQNAAQRIPGAGVPPRVFDRSGPHIGIPGTGAPPPADAEDGNNSNDDQENAVEEQPDDQTQAEQPVQPDATDANTQAQQPADPNQPNAGPRTPEQVLEMLRRQQQPGGMVPPAQTPPQPPPQQQ
jgi:hypothetical protein